MSRRITETIRIIDGTTQREIAGSSNARNEDHVGSNHIQLRLTLSTSETTFAMPSSIGDADTVVIENLDATQTIEIGTATGVRPFRVKPLRRRVIDVPAATANLYLAAVAGTPQIELTVIEA